MKYRVLDLFSGIGGFSLGLERTGGFETVAFCEIEPYCQAVLRKHWPEVPIYDDVRTLDYDGPVDVITGGYPCQPFSTASAGRRVAANLWPAMLAVIEAIRPSYVVTENVAEVPQKLAQHNLEKLGYKTLRRNISGVDCGAWHHRSRWWVCAYANHKSELHSAIDAEVAELPKLCKGIWSGANYASAIRVFDGVPKRVDRLRALGNAVIPQIPEIIGRAILNV